MRGFLRSLLALLVCVGMALLVRSGLRFSIVQTGALAGTFFLLVTWIAQSIGFPVFAPLESPRLGVVLFAGSVFLVGIAFFFGPDVPGRIVPSTCGTCNLAQFQRLLSGALTMVPALPYGVRSIVDSVGG